MKILNRYIIREFLKLLFFIIVFFIGVSIISDFLRELNLFMDKKASFYSVARYLLYTNFHKAFLLLPIAVLLSTLFSMGAMARAGEFVALKVAGINIKKTMIPLFAASIILSVFVLFAVFNFVPVVVKKGYAIKNIEILKQAPTTPLRESWKLSVVLSPKSRLHVGYVNLDKKFMKDIILYKYDDNFQMAEQIIAQSVLWAGNEWSFFDGVRRIYKGGGIVSEKKFDRLKAEFSCSPEDFILTSSYPEEKTWNEHVKHIDNLNKLGFSARRARIDFLYRIAVSFSNFIVIFIGVHFASTISPRHGKLFGFTSALVLAFLYYGIAALGRSLGENGIMPEYLAAWFGNIILGVFGVVLFIKIPT